MKTTFSNNTSFISLLFISTLILTLSQHPLMASDLNIGVIGNNRGLLTPCGCKIPSGGWARTQTMINDLDEPHLTIGAGNHFFHHTPMPKEDQLFEQKKAVFQAELFSKLNFDVVNAGQFDLCYGLNVLRSLQKAYDLPLISSNILTLDGELAFPPHKTISIAGVDIMFVGICLLEDGFNYKIKDPLQTLIQLHEDGTFRKADLVILLADAPAKVLSDFVKDFDGIDIIIASKEHAITTLPIHYKNTALIQMGSQGKYFGQLNINFKESGVQWIDISPDLLSVKSAEKVLKETSENKKRVKRQLKRQKSRLRSTIKNNPNHYHWTMTLMDASIKDDPMIREQVEKFVQYP